MVTAEQPGRWTSLARYLRNPSAYMLAVGTGKDLVHFRLGPRDFWLVNHPDLIERVLTRPDGLVRDRVFREARRFIGQGHTTMDGAPHRERRELVEPALDPDEIKAYGHRIVERATERSESWNDGAIVDVNLEMLELMLWVLTDVLLDADLEKDAPEVGEAVAATLKVVHRLFMPGAGALWKLPLPATRRFDDAIGRSDALIYGMIRERREASGQRADVLSALIRAGGRGNGHGLDDRQVRDELVTLLFGGRGDLAQATTWAWHLLAAHPDVERRWHDEIDGLLAGSAPTADDLPRLPYTRALFWEVLRLCPPGWVFVREVATDYELGDVVIRRGASIMISPLVTHRDPRYWADPLRFEPHRWLEGGVGPERPYTDLTFGGGDRTCVGRHLAAMVGPLVLATIGQRWRPRAVPGERVQEIGRFNLEPKGGLRMRLERRRTT